MLNIFQLSLQRTGSNFIEVLMNKNLEGVAIRSQMIDVKTEETFSKHIKPCPLVKFDRAPIPVDYFMLIFKNPYMWMESVALIHEMGEKGTITDIQTTIFTQVDYFEKYNLFKDGDFGEANWNFDNLVGLFKDYYSDFLELTKEDTRVIPLKYEDFLDTDKAICWAKKFASLSEGGRVKDNFELLDKPVRFSDDFTDEQALYYKRQIPTLLSTAQINRVTELLGADFIEKLGYKVIGEH